MSWTARDTQVQAGDAPAYATHNGDAGSDACDRDLAFCLLSQEVDSLFEIDHALQRIEEGRYGICEMSGEPIPVIRLNAIPFARFTVECQSEMERRSKFGARQEPPRLLFARNGAQALEDLEAVPE
ncbi:MAG: TraR/DksA C4-type zinc finger protein [Chthoniobacterales bacterium]|nr:TraR/DksA C4-type zinc finger protein [Chthoniobacterales bacterium]